ncbi:enoyl-CoA hydratase/isomerase family protein [Phaeacidiphilus oryzae]|uniref:enoyl-CoA hydratase/isomerase family protein n=1 Tax=Phaeacidiphilus oryzae TaxID=348818 RepID=UPI00056C7784|nr:enoyl-CoA hydratase-related protein [Phaeacidiphilus oryzae]
MTTVEQQSLLVGREGAVATITINRPRRKNALDHPTWRLLHAALVDAGRDPEVRAVVLTGAEGDFCAGADLSGERPGHPLEAMRRVNEVALALHELPKPTIAKVRGVAVGAGWSLALACDLVAAAPDARFSQIFARRGLSLDCGGSWLLPRLVGMQQAKRLALFGDFVDAPEARSLGLVTWVREDPELDGFVAEQAARLAAQPPVAIAQSKALLHEGVQASLREALENEARAQVVNFATEDAQAAKEAFLAKTTPVFTGRWAVRR